MRRKRKMWLLLLMIPIAAYGAIVAALYFGQTWVLFPAGSVGPADPLPPSATRLDLATPAGERLSGIHIPPAGLAADGRLLILGFGGNAWNADTAAAYLHETYPQADIVTFHYRGYAPSGGSPSAASFREDAVLVHDFARARVRPGRVVAVGFSIGSGVAASLAVRRALDGLILVTPFDSLAAVAAGHYPWLPVRLLLRHRMEPAQDLAGADVPVALIAAAEDSLIPPARTEALRRAVPNLRFSRTIGGGHNDIYQLPAFRRALRDALAGMD